MDECSQGITYQGVVDDPRTTDQAWIETVRFYAPPKIAAQLELCVSDTKEIRKVGWHPIATLDNMYASHRGRLATAKARLAANKSNAP